MQFVDAHAHIQDRAYASDRAAVIARAHTAGVTTIIVAGADLESSVAAVDLAEREPSVWATAGIHPHVAAMANREGYAELRRLAASPRLVAIGEIGLDFYRDLSPRPLQERAFAEQLQLAESLDLPVVIHSRDADAATVRLLAPWAERRRAAGAAEPFGVMHCYAYGPQRLSCYLGLGLYISVPGTVTYPKAELVRGAAKAAPADTFVIETDCPYLTPQSRRGRRNEPALLAETAACVADLRSMTPAELAQVTTANAARLYRLEQVSGTAFQKHRAVL